MFNHNSHLSMFRILIQTNTPNICWLHLIPRTTIKSTFNTNPRHCNNARIIRVPIAYSASPYHNMSCAFSKDKGGGGLFNSPSFRPFIGPFVQHTTDGIPQAPPADSFHTKFIGIYLGRIMAIFSSDPSGAAHWHLRLGNARTQWALDKLIHSK